MDELSPPSDSTTTPQWQTVDLRGRRKPWLKSAVAGPVADTRLVSWLVQHAAQVHSACSISVKSLHFADDLPHPFCREDLNATAKFIRSRARDVKCTPLPHREWYAAKRAGLEASAKNGAVDGFATQPDAGTQTHTHTTSVALLEICEWCQKLYLQRQQATQDHFQETLLVTNRHVETSDLVLLKKWLYAQPTFQHGDTVVAVYEFRRTRDLFESYPAASRLRCVI